ncbi:hypothetical protein Hte_000255 [Hypoxylon texense]
MSTFDHDFADANMSSSSSDSGSDVEQQGTRRMSGLEGLQAALDETPIDQAVEDHVSIDQASIGEGSAGQNTISGLAEQLGKLNGDIEKLKAEYREELAAVKAELAAAAARARPADTPNPSRQGSWWKDMADGFGEETKRKYGHIARNEGSGNTVFQSGGGWSRSRARNIGEGNSVMQSGGSERTLCLWLFVILVGAGASAAAVYLRKRYQGNGEI